MKDRQIVDTDGNVYEGEDAFLSHACAVVTEHLKKFDGTREGWWKWRDELCWWDAEMDERLSAGDISEATHKRFVECLYGGLEKLNTHIW